MVVAAATILFFAYHFTIFYYSHKGDTASESIGYVNYSSGGLTCTPLNLVSSAWFPPHTRLV